MSANASLKVGGRTVQVSNLDKVFYPEAGFTKGDVIDYYVRISSWLLPHLIGRPITLKRYPDGVTGVHFYERHCPTHRPSWLKTSKVDRASGGPSIDYCIVDNLPALVWAANLADLELHTFLHLARNVNRPTAVVLDLDPGAPADVIDCCAVAMELKSMLESVGLRSFAKTSGSKGMQVYVPLNYPVTYERTKAFARALAESLERKLPDQVVSRMGRDLRAGKVLVDWSQNDPHKTTVNAYSLRARERPTVSTPVTWEEIGLALRKKDADCLLFEAGDVLNRVKKLEDIFKPVLTLKQRLPTPPVRLSP